MTRGEVVLVDWLYSDRTGSKIRPALVVQADFLNGRIADTVLVSITRTDRAAGTTEVLLDPAVETRSGLRHRSVASCSNLVTVDQAIIIRTLGRLSVTAMQQVDAALKKALDLP
jgi:mRNA interferase MazF